MDTNTKQDKAVNVRKGSSPQAGQNGPMLPVLSVVAGAAALACGYLVSWIGCIALGIVAAAIGAFALNRHATPRWLAKLGIGMGILGIIASFALVAVVAFQLMRLGLS